MEPSKPSALVVRAGDRFVTRQPGVESAHSFSFGAHYRAGDTHFGVLVAHNDERVAPGAGFPAHPHRDVEIVTWVVAGRLRHADSAGNEAVIGPGWAQRTAAGSGIEHAETSAGDEELRFVQSWLVPDSPGGTPTHGYADLTAALAGGGLVTVAGRGGPLPLGRSDAVLLAGRLAPHEVVAAGPAPYLHVFVVTGSVSVAGVAELTTGDAARLVAPGPRRLTAGAGRAEVLLWAMGSSL